MICLGTVAKCNLIKYISHVIIIIIISHDISYLGWLVMFGIGSLEPADDYATSTVSRWENMSCKWCFFPHLCHLCKRLRDGKWAM